MDQETKEFLKGELGGLAMMVNKGFESVHGELTEIKSDVAILKSDVSLLQSDVATLQVTVNRIDVRTQNQVGAVYGDTTILKTEMKEGKGDIAGIKAHVGITA